MKHHIVCLLEQYFAGQNGEQDVEDPLGVIEKLLLTADIQDSEVVDKLYNSFQLSQDYDFGSSRWDRMADIELKWLGSEVGIMTSCAAGVDADAFENMSFQVDSVRPVLADRLQVYRNPDVWRIFSWL